MYLIRPVIQLLLISVASASLFLAALMPFLFAEDAAENREILALFQSADTYARDFRAQRGRLPDSLEIRAWAQRLQPGWPANSLTIDPHGCTEEGFARRAGGELLLSVWRGEWADCYASPSGTHTLATSVSDYLKSVAGWTTIVFALVGITCAWLGWRLRPIRRRRLAR